MRVIIIFCVLFLFYSCKSEENKIRDIIGESFVNNSLSRLKELPITEDHILSFPFNLYLMKNNIEHSKDDDFKLVRYAFSMDGSTKYVMFYIVNFKDNSILNKSSNYNDYEKYFKSISNSEDSYNSMESYYRGDVLLEKR